MNLKDKVVVVTGSSRGIGRAIAGHLAGLGAKVVITSRNAVNVKKACSILEKENCRVSGIPADISKESDIKKLFDFGRDVLVEMTSNRPRCLAADTTELFDFAGDNVLGSLS